MKKEGRRPSGRASNAIYDLHLRRRRLALRHRRRDKSGTDFGPIGFENDADDIRLKRVTPLLVLLCGSNSWTLWDWRTMLWLSSFFSLLAFVSEQHLHCMRVTPYSGDYFKRGLRRNLEIFKYYCYTEFTTCFIYIFCFSVRSIKWCLVSSFLRFNFVIQLYLMTNKADHLTSSASATD